jgi:hypothetical protein
MPDLTAVSQLLTVRNIFYTKNSIFEAFEVETICTVIRIQRTHEKYVIRIYDKCEVPMHMYLAIKT